MEPQKILLAPEADAALRDLQEHIERRLALGQDLADIQDWAGKLVGAAVRVAVLLHIAEHVGDVAPWGRPISGATMARATSFCRGYLIPHARAAFSQITDSPTIASARKVLDWLRREGRTAFSSREAHKTLGAKGERKRVLDPVLGVLESHGYIRPAPRGPRGPGRPSEVYEVNPAVHSDGGGHA